MAEAVDWGALQKMTAAGMTPEMIRALNPNDPLRVAYGWQAAFADIPELKAILDQAVAQNWSEDTLVAAVQNSKWAKEKRQAQIDYEVNRRLHPADVAAQRKALEQKLQNEATQLGMTLTKDRLNTMSGYAMARGFTEEEIQRMLLAEFHFDPKANNGNAQGQAASTLDELKGIAKAYMVPVSDQALTMWVNAITRNEQKVESFTEWARNQAKGMFPTLSGQIDGGMTPKTLLDPYAQLVQQELGVADPDMSDPRYLGGIIKRDDKGVTTMSNLDEWRKYIRTNPSFNWAGTTNAQNMAAGLGDALAQEMGAKR